MKKHLLILFFNIFMINPLLSMDEDTYFSLLIKLARTSPGAKTQLVQSLDSKDLEALKIETLTEIRNYLTNNPFIVKKEQVKGDFTLFKQPDNWRHLRTYPTKNLYQYKIYEIIASRSYQLLSMNNNDFFDCDSSNNHFYYVDGDCQKVNDIFLLLFKSKLDETLRTIIVDLNNVPPIFVDLINNGNINICRDNLREGADAYLECFRFLINESCTSLVIIYNYDISMTFDLKNILKVSRLIYKKSKINNFDSRNEFSKEEYNKNVDFLRALDNNPNPTSLSIENLRALKDYLEDNGGRTVLYARNLSKIGARMDNFDYPDRPDTDKINKIKDIIEHKIYPQLINVLAFTKYKQMHNKH